MMRSLHPVHRLFALAACALFIHVCHSATATSGQGDGATAENIRKHISFLARDELGGRNSGEPGLEVAAEYIASHFRLYGLDPAGDNGSYFQRFSVPRGAEFTGQAGATLELSGDLEVRWASGRDVEAFGYADPSAAGVVEAPLVYAGYGITTTAEDRKKGLEYDDYAGVDVAGKVVIVVRYTPRQERDDNPFGGRDSPYAPFNAKLRSARERGAAGVVFVTPPGPRQESIYGLARRAAPRRPTLPALLADRGAVERLMYLRGIRLRNLVEATDENLKPQSFELEGVRIRFSTTRGHLRLRNVAGRLAGSDPKLAPEAILIGAHYDHIGRFGQQVSPRFRGQVHNGADDNASGVSAVLELARLISEGPRPRRSFVFVCFSGEEIGLFGSRHWVRAPRYFKTGSRVRAHPHPPSQQSRHVPSGAEASGGRKSPGPVLWEQGILLRATGKFRDRLVEVTDPTGSKGWVESAQLRQVFGPEPLHRIVTMVNLDMIGHAGPDGSVSVIGAESSKDFPSLLEEVSRDEQVPITAGRSGHFAGGSDHMHFVRRNIPVLFFWTGIHKYYNTPDDDVGTINIEGEARVVNLVRRAAERIAARDSRPRFDPAYATIASGGHGKPRLGVEIDRGYPGRGARVGRVMPESVAAKAGLHAGDIIVDVGGERVDDFQDLVDALEKHSSGTVPIKIRREMEEVTLEAEFPKRRSFRVHFGSVPDYAFAEKGVRFDDIRSGSPAAQAGVKPGDVLVRWAGKEVEDLEHWTQLLRAHKPGDTVKIQIRRKKELLELEVVLGGR